MNHTMNLPMSQKQPSTRWVPILVGAALGAAAGVLFAPRSGAETRRRLIDMAPGELRHQIVGAAERVSQVVEHGVATYQSVSEELA